MQILTCTGFACQCALFGLRMSEKNQDESKSERTRLTLFNFESAVDKQIREAIERGDFDGLKNQGKPLDLARDPNVPADWEMAFHLLKNSGYAPDWIETRTQVEREREKLFAPLNRFLAHPPAQESERRRLKEKITEKFRSDAAELNRLIDTFNLKAPTAQVHMRRIRVEDEIEKFLAKCK